MAAITPVDPRNIAVGALVVKNVASGGGDTFPALPGKNYLVIVNNGHTSPQNVSIDDPASGAGQVEANAVPVTNATSRGFLLSRPLYGKQPTADIALTYSGVTALTVEVYGPLN